MSNIDFSCMLKSPTSKQKSLYRQWEKYLSDSKLNKEEIHKRASHYASEGKAPPNV